MELRPHRKTVGRPENLNSQPRHTRRYRGILACILVSLILAIVVFARAYYLRERQDILQSAQNELGAIADLKVSQIVNWRREREVDASFFSQSLLMAERFRDYISDPANMEGFRNMEKRG